VSRRTRPLLVLVLALGTVRAAHASPSADRCDSEVASRWADLLYETIQTVRLFPPSASRVIGYFGVTLHEAVAPGRSRGVSLAGQLNDLASVPQPDPEQEHEWRVVVNAASARLLDGLFAGSPPTLARVEELRASIHAELARDVPAAVLDRSEAQGMRVADAILAWSKTDGFTELTSCPWTAPVGAGLWQPTPLDLRPALEPCWGNIRPFALQSGEACEPPPPTPYSTDPKSQFVAEMREVEDAVDHLTPAQRDIALYWSDDRSVTAGPPGHWMALVAQLSRERSLPLGIACEAQARVGIAVADGFISCWHAKYRFDFVRPVTCIQQQSNPTWLPLLATPPFPEYPSGHSVQSAAAARALTDLFGPVAFTDRVLERRGLKARSFASFEDAAREAAISRLYGGIHFRPSIDDGLIQGDCVARQVAAHVAFERCSPGDIYPEGRGDGAVTLADYLVARRRLVGTAPDGEWDATCADVEPGTWTGPESDPSRGWRPEGDGHLGPEDALMIGRIASGAARIAWMRAAQPGEAGGSSALGDGAEHVLRVVATKAGPRAAFALSVRGLPSDAVATRVEAAGCGEDEIGASRLAGGAWSLTCAPDAASAAPAGTIATLHYRCGMIRGLTPTLVSEVLGANLRPADDGLRIVELPAP
jgi:hypothetical protein